jgi:L-alanine-DL-glutamate epimerase-like enolase superfamily enzyme
MKIISVTDHHADAGWRVVSFLKIVTDEGLIGWSEFAEARSTPGLTHVIRQLSTHVIGLDPCNTTHMHELLRTITRLTPGGLSAQACAAIENACLDIRGKALSLPVHALLGGAMRLDLPMYWSHCGTARVRHGQYLPPAFAQPLRNLDDVVSLGQQVRAMGYSALKTNVILFEEGGPRVHSPGLLQTHAHWPDRLVDDAMLEAVVNHISALRQGAGQDAAIMIDLNFNFRPASTRALCRKLEPLGMSWVELDLHDPSELAAIRQSTSVPIASLETVYGMAGLRTYLDAKSVDFAIIDVQWNGMINAMKMSALADSYEVNVAAHNYHGHLSTLMGAHLCALLPNFKAMEFVVDEVPWMQDLFTHSLEISNGVMHVPSRPGWGMDVNEEALRAHPPK